MISVLPALLVAAGYLSGSVPFGVLITRRATGLDVRTKGSGNIGATNVARVAGKKLGVLVLVLDALKGVAPVLVARLVLSQLLWLHAGVALAAFLGHVFPVWLKFKGGKGVATALGVLLVLVPYAALCGFVAYAAIFAIWRVSSIGSLVGGLTALVVAAIFAPAPYAALTILLFLLMIFTHRSNIGRLLAKSEKRL
jgi:glycerol-3-phosphate acyltransferase PlsY